MVLHCASFPASSGQRRDRNGMDYTGLRALLVVHGFITMAAGIVLTVAPGLIPSVVGIRLEPSADVVAYLLAGAEFGFAVLSFGGSRLTDSRALRLIVWSCIAFHGSSGVLGSGLIKSTIPRLRPDRQRPSSFEPACRSALRYA